MCHDTVNYLFLILLRIFLFKSINSIHLYSNNQFKNYNDSFIDSKRQISDNKLMDNSPETFIDLVKQAGYDAEQHEVTTEDGYILSIHRIPSGPKSPAAYGKPVILLMHGLLGSSSIWILRGPEHDFAYMLVDNGYDVWALNIRGNIYGRRHERFSTSDAKFWRFSWHEFGIYDTAASIDYILSITDQSQISLVGHSMGGTVELVLLSKRPEYNSKVNVALAFAPVAVVTHNFPGLFTSIGIKYGNRIEEGLRLLNMHEILPRNPLNIRNYISLCQNKRTQAICRGMALYLLGLTNFEEFDVIMLPRLLNHYPQGTSIETAIHYRQIIMSGKFQEYDFGRIRNLMKYGNFTPPEYPLDKVSTPIYLFYGPNDPYTTKKDIQAIMNKLSKATAIEVPYSKFSHLDFIFFNETKKYLYDDALEILNNYNDFNGTQNVINVINI